MPLMGPISALLQNTNQAQPNAEHPTPLSWFPTGGDCCSGSPEFHPIKTPTFGNGDSPAIPLWDPSDDSDSELGEELAMPLPPAPQLQHSSAPVSISPVDMNFMLDVPGELLDTPLVLQMQAYLHLH